MMVKIRRYLHIDFREIVLPCSFISIPPKTAPQNLPNPWWIPWRNPCVEVLNSGSVLWAINELIEAHTPACVIPKWDRIFCIWSYTEFVQDFVLICLPCTNSKGSISHGQVIKEMYKKRRQLHNRPNASTFTCPIFPITLVTRKNAPISEMWLITEAIPNRVGVPPKSWNKNQFILCVKIFFVLWNRLNLTIIS